MWAVHNVMIFKKKLSVDKSASLRIYSGSQTMKDVER